MDRIGPGIGCRVVGDFCSGIKCRFKCFGTMGGDFRCRYAPGVGNGTVVYQQPGFSFKTTRRKIKL